MRAPEFWSQPDPAPLARLLIPAGFVYGAVAARRMARRGERAPVPVVCAGNFTLGGAGKTPTALKIAALLQREGQRPAFLTRGYGGRLAGPVLVEAGHTAAEVGDEPLLLARRAPTVVSRDRPAGARLAAQRGASVIVMDDGLQNPSLTKQVSIAVVDGSAGFGNGLTFPAGPLRAPLGAQWPQVDAVLVVGPGRAGDAVAAQAHAQRIPVWRGRLVPNGAAAAALSGRRVLAFAGIGRPEKFFATLGECGAQVAAAKSFPDHHAFTPDDLAGLRAEARRQSLVLVTTEKDAARLVDAEDVRTLPVELEIEDERGFAQRVLSRLGAQDPP